MLRVRSHVQLHSMAATRLGVAAIALWAILASLTTLAGPIPPFQLTAMTFVIGTAVGLVFARATGQSLATIRTAPIGVLALGVYGLLGFHACYFFALQNAPALEASLIVYLWPLLIVVMSGALPANLGGSALRWWHVCGAALGFAGSAIILFGASDTPSSAAATVDGQVATKSALGFALAFLAALIWSSYSVGLRRYASVPSVSVIACCAATAIGAGLFHMLTETWAWPANVTSWLSIAGLGIGPTGLAFYLWDEGMKHGNIRLLGVLSYTTPVISTLILAAIGLGQLRPNLWLATALVTAGALVAGLGGQWFAKPTEPAPPAPTQN
jgi:drug/metabolite transporter (DMT)-like permease